MQPLLTHSLTLTSLALVTDAFKVYQNLPARLRDYLKQHPRPSFVEDCAKLKTREILRKDLIAAIDADCAAQEAADKVALESWRPEGVEIGQVRGVHSTHWMWPLVEVVGFQRDHPGGRTVVVDSGGYRYHFHPSWLRDIGS